MQTTEIHASLAELIALRAQAHRLDLAPRGRVLATRSGGHLSRFRGRGMEFDESRVYQRGDDIRHMDWRVTARAGVPHVKLFREERERPVWLLVDQGPSMRFGTRVTFKSVIAAQAAALLGWAAVDRGDRVGGLVFDEHQRLERRPAARGAGLLPLLHRLAQAPGPAALGLVSLGEAAGYLARLVHPGSLVVIISDFAGLQSDRDTWPTRLGAGNEVILVAIHDALEIAPPPPGRYPVTDGRRPAVLDVRTSRVQTAYRACFQERQRRLEQLARRDQMHLLRLTTGEAVGPALALGLGIRPKSHPGTRGGVAG